MPTNTPGVIDTIEKGLVNLLVEQIEPGMLTPHDVVHITAILQDAWFDERTGSLYVELKTFDTIEFKPVWHPRSAG